MTDVRQVPLKALLEMRERILTPGHPGRQVIWPYDATAEHFAMYDAEQIVACVSVTEQEMPGRTAALPYHLHSMAVEPAHQGQGFGRALLEWLTHEVRRRGGDLIWATARPSAVEFYRRCGYRVTDGQVQLDTGPPMTYIWQVP